MPEHRELARVWFPGRADALVLIEATLTDMRLTPERLSGAAWLSLGQVVMFTER